MSIKIFTMQKNEHDILEFWILYHTKIVGLENLYIIDNESTDDGKSLEILNKYRLLGLNVYMYDNYFNKGDYICELIKKNTCDIAVPLDIDEFIVLDTCPEISTDADLIKKEFDSLESHGRYSFNYYLTSRNTEMYYSSIADIKYFDKVSNIQEGNINLNKKFFNSNLLLGLDHGNHIGTVKGYNSSECINTRLVLIHYHFRGVHMLVEKCKNDILGLGYINNINDLQELQRAIKNKVRGLHNIATYLKFLEQGPSALIMSKRDAIYCDIMSKTFECYTL